MSFEDSVLICDEVDPVLTKILTDNGLKVSYEPEITPEQILEKISTFNIVIVRSRTTITKEMTRVTTPPSAHKSIFRFSDDDLLSEDIINCDLLSETQINFKPKKQ